MRFEDKNFLSWLAHRLVHKHNYDSDHYVVQRLRDLCNDHNIDDNTLDLIISRYYQDFFLNKVDGMSMGYSEEDRHNLRMMIRSLVNDIISINIPNNTIK